MPTDEQVTQEAQDRYTELMMRLSEAMSQRTQEDLTPEQRHAQALEAAKRQAKMYNQSKGSLKDGYSDLKGNVVPGDGYDCPICKNRGDFMDVVEYNGTIYQPMTKCKCMIIRESIWRMRRSGLENGIKKYTFERFENRGPWCEALIRKARAFLAEGVQDGAWLYFGGQPGCGKTHICTAVCRKLLASMPVYYMLWTTESKKLRAIVNNAEEYENELSKLVNIEVLYIDDLFKPTKNEKGETVLPTSPEVKIAFEIINLRDVADKTTIISSEYFLDELIDIDEGTGSRISKRCKGYYLSIARDRQKNYRIASVETV